MTLIRQIVASALVAWVPNASAQFLDDRGPQHQRPPVRTCTEVQDSNAGTSMRCVDSVTLTNPRDMALKHCQDQARPHRGTPQWAPLLESCIKRVMDEHLPGKKPE